MDKKRNELLKNTLIFTIGNLGAKIIQFLLVPLYTYILSSAEYGETEIIITAVNVLIPLFSVSISDGMLRFGLDKRNDGEVVLKSSLLIASVGIVIFWLISPLLALNDTIKKWFLYFVVIMVLRIFRDLLSINLKICDMNKWYAIDSILYTLLLCGANYVLLYVYRFGVEGYFISYLIANAFSVVFIGIVGKCLPKIVNAKLDIAIIKALLVYSIPMIPNAIAWWITNSSDRFMLEYYMSASEVGIYAAAAKIPAIIAVFSGIFNQAWTIASVKERDGDNDRTFFLEVMEKYCLIMFLSISLLQVILKPFMMFYVGEDFRDAVKYAPILLCSAFFVGISAFLASIYAAEKKNVNVMVTTVVGAIVNIVLNVFLINMFGIMGAAVATYISWILIAVVRLYDVKKFSGLSINYRILFWMSIVLLVQGLLNCISFYYELVFSLTVIICFAVIKKSKILEMVKSIKNK